MKDTAEKQAYRDVLKQLNAAVRAADTAANIFPIQIGGSARYKEAILYAQTIARDAVRKIIPNDPMEKLVKDYTEAEEDVNPLVDFLNWTDAEIVDNREFAAFSKIDPDTIEAIERTPGKDIAFRKVRTEIVRRLGGDPNA